jgi:transcriptional regulator with XRE-family HTH domain
MPLTPDQLRAARALLNISQDDLAKESGVAVTSIRQFELGTTTNLQQKTENALLAFLAEKIEFIGARGVALREADHLVLEGETVIAQMFEDIQAHLSGQEDGEALFLYGDTPCSLQSKIVDYCLILKKDGFSYRSISQGKNEAAFVRVIPANFTPLPLQVVYGASVAQMISANRILLVRSPMLAEGLKQTFEMLWATLPVSDAEIEEDARVRGRALRA